MFASVLFTNSPSSERSSFTLLFSSRYSGNIDNTLADKEISFVSISIPAFEVKARIIGNNE